MKSSKHIITFRNKKQFNRVFEFGKSYVSKNLVLYALPNDLDYNRLGFIISKKVGNSVTRNRLRRILKEVYRNKKESIKDGFDMIFIVRHRASNLDYRTAEGEFVKLLKKAKIIHKGN